MREKLADQVAGDEAAAARILAELLQGKPAVAPTTETGEAVAKLVSRTLVVGYCEAALDQGMTRRWGAEGPD